jgi:hypothetical protein
MWASGGARVVTDDLYRRGFAVIFFGPLSEVGWRVFRDRAGAQEIGEIRDMNKLFAVCLIAGGLCLPAAEAGAQEVVHVLAATVRFVNQQNGMIIVSTDDGTAGMFKGADVKVQTNLDKSLVAKITLADKFMAAGESSKGDHLIVFYFGGEDDNVRSVFAVTDLGKGPFDKTTGTVTKFDRHAHLLTVKDSTGTEVDFRIGANTVADTTTGAVEGYKFDPSKGEKVRITATSGNGGEDALLIVPTT